MNYRQMMITDLQDLYQAEVEQESELRELASEADNDKLRAALEEHAAETEQHAMRLRQIFDMLGESPGGRGEVTPGVAGMVEEAFEKVGEIDHPVLADLALIGAAQKMEHYEIACYGTARAMARTLGMDEAARLLQASLEEEEAADRRLTEVAMPIHKQAAQLAPAMTA